MQNKCIRIQNGEELEIFRDGLLALGKKCLLSYTDEYKAEEPASSGYMIYYKEHGAWVLTKTPEEEILSLAEGINALIRLSQIVPLDLRVNYISVDYKSAVDSDHNFYKIGQEVCHEGANIDEIATILSFEIDEQSEEVKVHTTKGWAHLDFIFPAHHGE